MKGGDKTYEDAEILCFGLCLRSTDNHCRAYTFESFVGHDIQDGEILVVMKNCEKTFLLKDLEIIGGQSVSINELPKEIKEMALDLNKFRANERKMLIDKQIEKLNLNNKITASFGVTIKEEMLEGAFSVMTPPKILLGNDQILIPDRSNNFKIDCRNVFKRGNFKKIILLATSEDKALVWKDFVKIAKNSSNKFGKQLYDMLLFERFNTSSNILSEWIKVVEKFKGMEALVVCIDGNPNSHGYLKFAETCTGVITQHLKLETICGVRFQTMQNISFKMNVKADGLNNAVIFGEKM
uniref:Uncharacterized protein n=1 Tax=Panagrolaimus superbus TaxID=310955 RepID=A0A914YRM9_9BILA